MIVYLYKNLKQQWITKTKTNIFYYYDS